VHLAIGIHAAEFTAHMHAHRSNAARGRPGVDEFATHPPPFPWQVLSCHMRLESPCAALRGRSLQRNRRQGNFDGLKYLYN